MKNTNNNNEIKVLMVHNYIPRPNLFKYTYWKKKTLKNAENNNIYQHVLPTY